ncbi:MULTISPECIES: DUF6058 family natural product biosynthesis protein [unclassified Pseudoalteromonas]|uniref:DUF6058 family natural product biosynthesis protein n=1 Tax=unclassified Pseudoalteromonas TaxID=194690 RepID=UPI0020974400|nr:DUF6058 family natural product biosynthesis protein [Pseudoalteromonas sp. XMcav2-N]MCO7190538.1 DUF6058 family natural product biosynthesis protein [Pseudoalteromonas sp. XMcav2-N]
MRLSQHLNTHFFSAEELCSTLRITQDQLLNWQELCIFPNASYSLENQIKCSSYLGLYECVEHTEFYPRGAEQWGQQLLKHQVEQSSHAYELFQQKYTQTLSKCAQQGLVSHDCRFNEDLPEHIQQSWQQYLCSKYGVISQNGLVEEVVYIDLGRALVDALTEERTASHIAPEHRAELLSALKLLNRALSHHMEHEKPMSIRYKYIECLVAKYDLSIR